MYPDSAEAFDENAARRTFSGIGFSVVLSYLVTLFAANLLYALIAVFFPAFLEVSWFSPFLNAVSMYLFGFPVGYLLIRRLPIGPRGEPVRMTPQVFFSCLLLCFGVMYAGSLVSSYLIGALEVLTGNPYEDPVGSLIASLPIPATLLFTVILPPIAEELFFRKVLIDRLSPFGDVVAIVISSLVFGLFHGNFYQLFYAFGIGVLFGWIYIYTKKIIYPILFHTIFNFFGSVLVPQLILALELGEGAEGDAMQEAAARHPLLFALYILYCVFIYASIAGSVYLVFTRQNILRDSLREGSVRIPAEKRMRVMFLNAGVILLILLFIFLFVLSFF